MTRKAEVFMDHFQLQNGVYLHVHPLNKYRTVAIQVSFSMPLSAGRRPYALLCSLLLDSCEKYSEKLLVQKRLDELYGASFLVDSKPVGGLNRVRFSISGCDRESVKEDLLPDLFETISQFILHPRLENGVFPDSMFEECREQEIMTQRMLTDDPFYFTGTLAAEAYGGNPARRAAAKEDYLLSLTPADCVLAWRKMRDEARIDINVLGNVDSREVLSLTENMLAFAPRSVFIEAEQFHPADVSTVSSIRDFPQVHVVQLYDTGLLGFDPMTPSLHLGNGIFGGLSTSLLFQNIREARGLCYSIDSAVMPSDGILRISSAVSPENLDALLESIEEQVQKMKNREFSEEDVELARRMYISSHLSALDTPGAMLEEDYRRAVFKGRRTTEELIEAFHKADRDTIAEAFADVTLKTTAIVGPGGNDVRE